MWLVQSNDGASTAPTRTVGILTATNMIKSTSRLFVLAILTFTLGITHADAIDDLRAVSLASVASQARQVGIYLKTNTPVKTLEKAKKAVLEGLKDPDSAKFNNVRLVKYLEGSVVCGEINAKNSYGGYVGYRQFVGGIDDASIIKIESNPDYADITNAANFGLKTACQ